MKQAVEKILTAADAFAKLPETAQDQIIELTRILVQSNQQN